MAEDGFRATNRIFEEDAMAKGDFAALARVYTDGARLFSPGVPAISGIAGIIDYWKGAAGALGVTGAKLHSLDLKVTGDRAAEVGRGDIFTAPGKPPITVKYVVLWKQEGGAWKWDVDCWNLDA
jgi:ketosteroid isomerase-like protein